MKRALVTLSIMALGGLSIACGAGTPGSKGGDTDAEQVDTDTAGTRDNPYAAGDVIEFEEWDVTLADTNTDAGADIEAENQFNEAIPDGKSAVMVEMTAKFTGKKSGTAWIDLRPKFVGSDGNTYGGTDSTCGVIPSPMYEVGEQFPDAEASGNVCAVVPTDAVDGGTWQVTNGLGKAEVFVAIK